MRKSKNRSQSQAKDRTQEKTRERERLRLAREIHDTLGQELTGFKIDLLWMKKRVRWLKERQTRRSLLDKIASMMGLLDAMVKGVQKICMELRPGVLDLGLIDAMEWQAREFQRRTGIKCVLSHSILMGTVPLDPERSTQVFRIFQEILTNVARHAGASEVRVDLAARRGTLRLEVADDGRGIPARSIVDGRSLGLRGMRERAALLGGNLLIRGASREGGRGTTVSVKIPLGPRAARRVS